MQLLTMAGYQLPELIAVFVALALLWTSARPGAARNKGIAGVGLLLFAAACRLATSLLQTWMIHRSDTMADMQPFFTAIGIVGMLLNAVAAVALVLIVWGLCQATRAAGDPSRT